MPDSPIKKRRLPFKRTAPRCKPRPRWFIQYKRAIALWDEQHFDEEWEPCNLAWAEKCVTHVPASDGKGVLTDSELHRLHLQKRCPCFIKEYGGDLHRWCTWKYHFEGVRVRRGVKGEIDGVDDDGLALWAAGIKQARITDFFQPTTRVGLEENGKGSGGTAGGGPTVQTPMGLGLGLPLPLQAGRPPRADRKITAFYSNIEKRQGVGQKAEVD